MAFGSVSTTTAITSIASSFDKRFSLLANTTPKNDAIYHHQ
jgi:hypothetical protein